MIQNSHRLPRFAGVNVPLKRPALPHHEDGRCAGLLYCYDDDDDNDDGDDDDDY